MIVAWLHYEGGVGNSTTEKIEIRRDGPTLVYWRESSGKPSV